MDIPTLYTMILSLPGPEKACLGISDSQRLHAGFLRLLRDVEATMGHPPLPEDVDARFTAQPSNLPGMA